MTTYSKFNPGTYWGKGYGANELQQPSLYIVIDKI